MISILSRINDITATYNNFGKPSWLVCMHGFKFKSRNGFWIEKMSLAQSYAFIMKIGSAKVLMEVGNMFQANKTIDFKKASNHSKMNHLNFSQDLRVNQFHVFCSSHWPDQWSNSWSSSSKTFGNEYIQ